mmetsp:Transcript_105237/g.322583  ORF Transcript_105237/g.322583 Transcript_105237/m.322583 type:complete len:222 (+) Transcript_105237:463-1128(+)
MLQHEVAVRRPREREEVSNQHVDHPFHLLVLAMLDQALNDTAAVLMLRDRQEACSHNLVDDELAAQGLQRDNDFLDHVVGVRAPSRLVDVPPKLRRQRLALRVRGRRIQRVLDLAAAVGVLRQPPDVAGHGRGPRAEQRLDVDGLAAAEPEDVGAAVPHRLGQQVEPRQLPQLGLGVAQAVQQDPQGEWRWGRRRRGHGHSAGFRVGGARGGLASERGGSA